MKRKNIKKTKKKNNLLSSTWIFLLIISVCLTSIAYSALGTNLLLSGEAHLRVPADIRITNISWDTSTNNGYETYSSEYYKDGIKMFTTLPELGSTVTYEVEVTNASDSIYMFSGKNDILYSNENIKYSINGLNIGDLIYANSVVTFSVIVSYDESVTELPSTNLSNFEIGFEFERPYKLTIDLNGGTSSQSATYYMIEGAQITLTSPTKENYTFSDWAVNGVNSNVTGTIFTMGTSDTTIKARYYKNLYTNGEVVYFNVKTGESCTETDYHADNSLTNYNGITTSTTNQTSCMKFYAFNDASSENNVKLLLDHNTTARAAWRSTTSNTSGPATGSSYVLGYLNSATSSWLGTETPNNYTVAQTSYGNYTIDYSTYKARLMTAAEIATITGSTFLESTTRYSNYFFFDTNSTTASTSCKSGNVTGCNYSWLYDRTSTSCTTYGCSNNASATTSGFWTATSTYGSTRYAWYIKYDGSLYYGSVNSSTVAGIRPVIEVKKEKFVDKINESTGGGDSGGDTSCEKVPFEFTFNGNYELINDGNNTYRLRLLESGTFSVNTDLNVDIFLVGGGGGGGNASDSGSKRPGGGGGGYTKTVTGVSLTSGTSYSVTVGTGGNGGSAGGQSKFTNSYIANGGKAGGTPLGENTGGDGGSGGGGGTNSTNTYGTGGYNGSDGADGYGGSTYGNQGGKGQGTTTCEFGEYTSSSCVYTDNGYYGLYGGGGGGAIYVDSSTSPYPSGAEGGYGGGGNGGTRLFSSVTAGAANTGGGGGGGGYYEKTGGKGGSGIVILRYTIPEQQECEGSGSSGGTTTSSFDFTYTGRYTIIDDGADNWRVKFLSSGTFTPTTDNTIDVFLVGGGEGGGCGSIPGGGGGYTTTQTGVSITAGTSYTITIGEGGTAATTATLSTWSSSDGGNGGTSSAFGYTAAGGGSEKQGWGGSGGGGMHNNGTGGTGGAYGLPGENVDGDNQYSAAGDGQHLTTCEFGRGTVYGCYSGVTAYGGGGGGGAISTGSPGKGGDGGGGSYGGNGETNTGGGGGSTYYNGSTFVKPGDGGSGIVIIRNTR